MFKRSDASSSGALHLLERQPKMAAMSRLSRDRKLSCLSISPCRAPGLLRRPQADDRLDCRALHEAARWAAEGAHVCDWLNEGTSPPLQ